MMKEAPLLSAGNLNLLFAIVHWLTVTATQTSGKIRGKIESFLQSKPKKQAASLLLCWLNKDPTKKSLSFVEKVGLKMHPEDPE